MFAKNGDNVLTLSLIQYLLGFRSLIFYRGHLTNLIEVTCHDDTKNNKKIVLNMLYRP
jgi:hypothetical protein